MEKSNYQPPKKLRNMETAVEKDSRKKNREGGQGADAAVVSQTTIFSLLPEIWDGILPYLDSTEFNSVINSSSQWNQDFHEKKSNKLFPLVSCVLLSYVPMTTALLLRRVNRATKTAIDDELSLIALAPPSQLAITSAVAPFGCQNRGSRSRRVVQLANQLQNCYTLFTGFDTDVNDTSRLPTVRNFVSKLNLNENLADDRTHRNPFMIRKIWLRGFLIEGFPSLPLINLVENFGHHLWSLMHEASYWPFTPNDARTLMRVLNFLPNLKILKLSRHIGNCLKMEPAGCRRPDFPTLPHLQLLDLGEECYEHKHFVLAHSFLEQYGTQLEALVCSGSLLLNSNQELLRLPTLTSHFPNLVRLRIGPIFGRSTFLKLAQIKLQLKELQIYHVVMKYCEEKVIKVSDLVTVMDNFSDTLIGLELFVKLDYPDLDLDWNEIDDGQNRGLTNVKKFSTDFKYAREGWLWRFIPKKFPNVEELVIDAYPNFTFHDKPELVRGFEILPRLKRIVVNVDNHSAKKCTMRREEFATPGK
ncbi:unnamed protein product [Orchesella dallaii]|uniref:Uncharacterized protein n=1 Tax=Orchesella dallaii TaxID=48710 RepID=A0ABP1RUB7_9HEXA